MEGMSQSCGLGHKHTQVKRKPFQTSIWLQESCWKFFRLSRNGFFFRINSGLWWGALSKLFDKGPTGLQFSLGMSDCDPPSCHASLNPSLTSASDIGLTCHRFGRFQQKIQLHSIQMYPYSYSILFQYFQSLFCKAILILRRTFLLRLALEHRLWLSHPSKSLQRKHLETMREYGNKQ